MIKGVGVDALSLTHLQKHFENAAFLQRVFTPSERAYIAARRNAGLQSAAGLYAAKEAIAKALGTGIGSGTCLQEIEITHTDLGAPVASLHGETLQNMRNLGANHVHLSIAHEGDLAIAFCVLSAE